MDISQGRICIYVVSFHEFSRKLSHTRTGNSIAQVLFAVISRPVNSLTRGRCIVPLLTTEPLSPLQAYFLTLSTLYQTGTCICVFSLTLLHVVFLTQGKFPSFSFPCTESMDGFLDTIIVSCILCVEDPYCVFLV